MLEVTFTSFAGDRPVLLRLVVGRGRHSWREMNVALARQRAQEAARHAPASPLVAGVEASSPELDVALPQGKRVGGTTTSQRRGRHCWQQGRWGSVRPTAHRAQGFMRCEPLHWLTKGRRWSKRWSDGFPQGVNNLGEALAAICSLASFPPMPGAPTYKPWKTRLQ
jgi:hypothetical protein